MTKVTIDPSDTPSEAIIKAAKKVVTVTDSLGRELKVKKLGAMAKLDLARIVGAEGAKNEHVMGPCALAFSVTEIDGDPVLPPASYNELRVLVGRLDDEGLDAVGQAHVDHFGIVVTDEVDDLKND